MTAPALPDGPPNPTEVDWVYVGRLTGQFHGPIARKPTAAEARAAVRGGVTINEIAVRVGVCHGRIAGLVGDES